jgi:hypothetical protein
VICNIRVSTGFCTVHPQKSHLTVSRLKRRSAARTTGDGHRHHCSGKILAPYRKAQRNRPVAVFPLLQVIVSTHSRQNNLIKCRLPKYLLLSSPCSPMQRFPVFIHAMDRQNRPKLADAGERLWMLKSSIAIMRPCSLSAAPARRNNH